ncbi:MAG: glutathione binding-like protein [Proteobacteria bacterium]|nr:glutathione binding-like protein [Pseudomonadota bacterium]
MKDQTYLCGDYGAADIATFMCFGFAQVLGAPFDAYANVNEWYQRVYARDAVRQEFDAMMVAAASA